MPIEEGSPAASLWNHRRRIRILRELMSSHFGPLSAEEVAFRDYLFSLVGAESEELELRLAQIQLGGDVTVH